MLFEISWPCLILDLTILSWAIINMVLIGKKVSFRLVYSIMLSLYKCFLLNLNIFNQNYKTCIIFLILQYSW